MQVTKPRSKFAMVVWMLIASALVTLLLLARPAGAEPLPVDSAGCAKLFAILVPKIEFDDTRARFKAWTEKYRSFKAIAISEGFKETDTERGRERIQKDVLRNVRDKFEAEHDDLAACWDAHKDIMQRRGGRELDAGDGTARSEPESSASMESATRGATSKPAATTAQQPTRSTAPPKTKPDNQIATTAPAKKPATNPSAAPAKPMAQTIPPRSLTVVITQCTCITETYAVRNGVRRLVSRTSRTISVGQACGAEICGGSRRSR